MRLSTHTKQALRGLMFCALLWGVPGVLHAEIFKCVSHEGKVSYSDSPCAKGAAQSADISAAVGACTTAECEAQRAQQAAAAQSRLREEKQTLSEMTQQRRQAEAEYAAERASLAEAQRLAAQEERSYQGDQTYYPAYPGYPLYPIPLPCKRGNCAGRHPRVGMNVPGHIPGRPVRPVRAPLLDPPTAILTNPPAPRSHR